MRKTEAVAEVFVTAFRSLPRKEKVKKAVAAANDFFESHVKPEGLGLKRLKGDYWEIRVDIKERVIFRFSDDLVEFIIVGTHDEIKNFLKNI